MDWFTTLEQKRRFALFSIILLMVATMALTSMRDPRTLDGFWHLKMGQDWIEQGLSPWKDHYSFTFNGEAIDSPPVVFQVVLYGLVKTFGVNGGFKLYKFICMSLALFMMLWWLQRIKAPVLIYLLVLPLLVTLFQFRATVRPELFSYVLEIIAIILYDRARGGIGLKQMLPIAFLMLIWTNYHSAILGYIIFFGLFIDLGLNQIKQKSGLKVWSKWMIWGLIIVALGFANPGWSHPIIAALTFPEEWKALIQEYQSSRIHSNVPSIYVLSFMAIVTLVLAWRQQLYGYLFVLAFLLANAVTTVRLIAPAGIVMLSIFAYSASQIDYRKWMSSGSKFQAILFPVTTLIIFAIPLLHNVLTARSFIAQNPETVGYYPYGLVEYMKDTGRSGRILNEYDMGGFLIYHLAPDSQVYIDGRTNILYPLEHYKKFREVFASAEVLKEEIEKYDIQYAVVRNTSDKTLPVELTGLMFLDYADVRYFLYSRKNANTPLAGKLWTRPYCWSENDQESLQEERLTAAVYFTPATQMHQFLQLLTDYGDSKERTAFLAAIDSIVYWPDASKRFVGYQILKINDYDLATLYFSSVMNKEPKDYLALALAQLRIGDATAAEDTLAKALSITWGQLEFVDLVIMHALLTEIKGQQAWTQLNDSYVEQLAKEIEGFQIDIRSSRPIADIFCYGFD